MVYILCLFLNRELHLLPAQGMASILVATAVFAGIMAQCTAYNARRRLELVCMALGLGSVVVVSIAKVRRCRSRHVFASSA